MTNPASAPRGTVALVFTDIQGSTAYWDKLGDGFAPVLDLHNRILRETLAAHCGYEVKTEGDAFMVAFAAAADALNFCLQTQLRLAAGDWPPEVGSLLVRMGVHTGEPIVENDPKGHADYFGPVVNRAARVAAAGHGGQILLSAAAWNALASAPLDVEVTELGEHRLKGLERPEVIRQVLPKTLADRTFPPLKTLDPKKTNLTRHPSSFVGREAELRQLTEYFDEEHSRLVSVLGPGGTGKTRLAQRWAGEHLERFPAGAWFIDLTEARSVEAICKDAARALGVPLAQADAVAQLGHAIQGRSQTAKGLILLVFDNFEQAVEHSAATVGVWMDMAPAARFLITSRVPLGVRGEREYQLEPLKVPHRKDTEKVGRSAPAWTSKITGYASVKLFIERARESSPRFEATDENVESIAQICVRLDGIPLAIELAAARVKVLSPRKILERLKQRFELLTGGRRGAPDRQATLRGTIDWSWELLTEAERSALAQLSVFIGGFFLEAAEEVLDLSAFADAPEALDAVQSLKDKSLLKVVEVEELSGEPRFSMYETVREYAGEKLQALGLREATESRWRAWLLRYGQEWHDKREGPGFLEGLRRLRLELDSLLLVAWADDVSPEEAARAALMALFVKHWHGPPDGGLPLIKKCLKRLNIDLDACDRNTLKNLVSEASEDVHRLVCAVGHIVFGLGKDSMQGSDYLELIPSSSSVKVGSLAVLSACYREKGDGKSLSRILHEYTSLFDLSFKGKIVQLYLQSDIAILAEKYEEAIRFLTELLVVVRCHNSANDQLDVLNQLFQIRLMQNQFEDARQRALEFMDLARATGIRRAFGAACTNLGKVYKHLNNHEKAREWYDRAFVEHRETGFRYHIFILWVNYAALHMKEACEGTEPSKILESWKAAKHCFEEMESLREVEGAMPPRSIFQMRVMEARCDEALGDFSRAKELAREALGISPGSRSSWSEHSMPEVRAAYAHAKRIAELP